jgi:hypothetical protein
MSNDISLFHVFPSQYCRSSELAILHFGSHRFRLVACPLVNSIRVDVEGENPLAVHSALVDTNPHDHQPITQKPMSPSWNT